MPTQLQAVVLSDDLEWSDEMLWSPVAQQVEVTTGGSVLVEESAQLAGRPITLQSGTDGDKYWGLATRTTVEALRALADVTHVNPMTLTLADGREFSVRWRHGENALEARPWKHIVPAEPDDLYLITLRLFKV